MGMRTAEGLPTHPAAASQQLEAEVAAEAMALFLFLLLALSRSSLVNLLGQSKRLRTSNRVGRQFHALRAQEGEMGMRTAEGLPTHPAAASQQLEAEVKWIIFMGLVEVFLLLLKLSTILKHLTNLLGLQEVISPSRLVKCFRIVLSFSKSRKTSTRPMKMIHLISTPPSRLQPRLRVAEMQRQGG
jgi:hypothetical protein